MIDGEAQPLLPSIPIHIAFLPYDSETGSPRGGMVLRCLPLESSRAVDQLKEAYHTRSPSLCSHPPPTPFSTLSHQRKKDAAPPPHVAVLPLSLPPACRVLCLRTCSDSGSGSGNWRVPASLRVSACLHCQAKPRPRLRSPSFALLDFCETQRNRRGSTPTEAGGRACGSTKVRGKRGQGMV